MVAEAEAEADTEEEEGLTLVLTAVYAAGQHPTAEAQVAGRPSQKEEQRGAAARDKEREREIHRE